MIDHDKLYVSGINANHCLLSETQEVLHSFVEIPIPLSAAPLSEPMDVVFTGHETFILSGGIVYQIGGMVGPTLEEVLVLSDLGITKFVHHHIKSLKRTLFAYSLEFLIRYDAETQTVTKESFGDFLPLEVSLF